MLAIAPATLFLFCALSVSLASLNPAFDKHKALTPSPYFTVTVDGISQFVYIATADAGNFNQLNASFVHVHLDRRRCKRIEVIAAMPFSMAALRPRTAISLQSDNNSRVSFDLREPGNFILEFDGDHEYHTLSQGLMIFADYEVAPSSATQYFGPGVHMLPYDEHFGDRVLWLQNDAAVHIEAGAVVVGYIRSHNAKNVTVRGRGILAASFLPGEAIPASQHDAAWCGYYGKPAIEILNSSDVILDGFTVVHSTGWDVKFESTIGVYIRGIKIIAWQCMNDGIDLSSSQDVLVERSFIRSNDDAVALKGRNPLMDTKNIVIRDTVLWGQTFGNCMEIGFEIWNAVVKNVTFLRNVCFHANRAVMSIHNAGHAAVQDISYQDIIAEGVSGRVNYNPEQGLQLIDLVIAVGKYSGPDLDKRGSIDNVVFSNVTYNPNKLNYLFSRLMGNSSQHKVGNIRFNNFKIQSKSVASLSDLNASYDFLGPVSFESAVLLV